MCAKWYKTFNLVKTQVHQGMRQEFGPAGTVCSIEESSGPQNPLVDIVLKASKSDVPKIYGFVHRCTNANEFPVH